MKYIQAYLQLFIFLAVSFFLFSCANMVPPGGGPIDSLPPRMVSATPKDSSVNVGNKKIVLVFNEYVDIDNPTENVIVSPLPLTPPSVTRKLRTVTINLQDSLEPNTTYSINFGNAIKDINEGNVLKNFTYVFSTGSQIHNGQISGKVMLAATGKVDSSLIVVLHNNLSDTAVIKLRPRYITRVNGNGDYSFYNIAPGKYAVYALPNDYAKLYDDSTELFAFSDTILSVTDRPSQANLYAFRAAEKKPEGAGSNAENTSLGPVKPNGDRLRYTTNAPALLGLLDTLTISFTRNVAIDTSKFLITDTSFKPVSITSVIKDSNSVKLLFNLKESTPYKLIIDKAAVKDTGINALIKSDTLSFSTRREDEYGSIRLKFRNVDASNNAVLLFIQNEKVVEVIPLNVGEWYRRLYNTGEYELRVLYDKNNNLRWDTGSFLKRKRQPEIVKDMNRKLSIRANVDNETEIVF